MTQSSRDNQELAARKQAREARHQAQEAKVKQDEAKVENLLGNELRAYSTSVASANAAFQDAKNFIAEHKNNPSLKNEIDQLSKASDDLLSCRVACEKTKDFLLPIALRKTLRNVDPKKKLTDENKKTLAEFDNLFETNKKDLTTKVSKLNNTAIKVIDLVIKAENKIGAGVQERAAAKNAAEDLAALGNTLHKPLSQIPGVQPVKRISAFAIADFKPTHTPKK